MSIADAREGLVAAISMIPGLHVYDVWPANVQPPAAVVVLSDWSYGTTYDGAMDAAFLVVVITQLGTMEQAQRTADEYLEISGNRSIPEVLRQDPTLGGRVQVADVVGGTRYATDEVDGISMMAPALNVEVKW